jgi:hypothetical protein
MVWAGHVEIRKAYVILIKKPEEESPLSDLRKGGRMILKWILRI